MPHQVDGTKSIMAREPAWYKFGTVVKEGTFDYQRALAVLNPTGQPIRKSVKLIGVFLDDNLNEYMVESNEDVMLSDFDSDTNQNRPLSIVKKDYGLIQREEQFQIVDAIVGNVGGAHYESAVNLRDGTQTVLTVYLGEYALDPLGINDKQKKFLWAFNSWDRSWAFRLKFGDFRVECANLAAMALRGSTDKDVVGSEWSTKHTTNIMERVEEAQRILGLWRPREALYQAQAEHMIRTPLHKDKFYRIVEGLYHTKNKQTGQMETDKKTVQAVQATYELSAASVNIMDTVWGGFNAVTEHHDWVVQPRGSQKSSVNELRFVKQLEDPTGIKQLAWDAFWEYAQEVKPFTMPDLADA